MANPAPITPLKRVDTSNDIEQFNIFDMNEKNFETMLERRANNRLTFLSVVKNALTEGVDYCNLPVKGKKALPTLLKGGGEVVCQILGLTPDIQIAESTEQSIVMRCYLLNEHQQIVSVGYGSRTYDLDAKNGGNNKTIKMAVKSAYLDAVIRAGALSSLFTLDLEDNQEPAKSASAKSNFINPKQVDEIQTLINQHKVDSQRFLLWLSKFVQNKGYNAMTEINQLPSALFENVIEKIPSFANTAN